MDPLPYLSIICMKIMIIMVHVVVVVAGEITMLFK